MAQRKQRRLLQGKFVKKGIILDDGKKPPPLHSKSNCIPPLIRPLRGHLPPGEGYPQKGRHTSATSDRTPPQSRRCRDSSPYTPGAFFVLSAPAAIFPLNNSYQAGGACRRPYIHRRYCVPPLIRPPIKGGHLPPGEGYFSYRRKISKT
mgnify:CR=1 FL=1